MAKRIINTEYIHPPIPTRAHDWAATWDDYDGALDDPAYPIGFGASEREAIQELLEQTDLDGDDFSLKVETKSACIIDDVDAFEADTATDAYYWRNQAKFVPCKVISADAISKTAVIIPSGWTEKTTVGLGRIIIADQVLVKSSGKLKTRTLKNEEVMDITREIS